jgi:heme exporter protein C
MKTKFTIFGIITLALLSYGLYVALVVTPTEATMGPIQRIFYYHLPAAFLFFLYFFANFLASIWYLWKRDPRADAIAVSTAEIGVVFCTVVLTTGPLWAKPVWGVWWVWDARLTSTLILWLIYISYLVLRRFATGSQAPVLAAALAIFGFVDAPLVYVSNRIFRTQHPQPVIAGGENSGLDPSMWPGVWWNVAAFFCLSLMLLYIRYKIERSRQELDDAIATAAQIGDPEKEKVLR